MSNMGSKAKIWVQSLESENMDTCNDTFIQGNERVVTAVDVTQELLLGGELELSLKSKGSAPHNRRTNGITNDQIYSNESPKRKTWELTDGTNDESLKLEKKKIRLATKLPKKKHS